MEKFTKFDCPVCFTALYLSPKVFQCSNGHILCEVCIEKLTSCPQCRVSFFLGKSRNLVLEGILDDLRYDCQYKKWGCPEPLKRNGINDHERSCVYGTSVEICKWLGPGFKNCDFKLSVENASTLMTHFKEAHPSRLIGTTTTLHLSLMERWEKAKAEDKTFTAGYPLRPSGSRDDIIMVILGYTKVAMEFSVVDLSLALAASDHIQVVFSVPDEKVPVLSWTIAPIGGIDSWQFLKKVGGVGAQFEVGIASLLKHCDVSGQLKMTVEVKTGGTRSTRNSGSGAGRKRKL